MRLQRYLSVIAMSVGVLLIPLAYAGTVAIKWNNVKQEIDGFGGGVCKGRLFASSTSLFDPLFSLNNGIGLSIIRMTTDQDANCMGRNTLVEQVAAIKEAMKRDPNLKVVACPWSPPAAYKSNGSLTNGGHLLSGHYQDYADKLADFANNMKSQGVNLVAVSIQNEPDLTPSYCGANFDGNEFLAFTRVLKPTFDAKGVTAKIMLGDKCAFSEDIAVPTLNDPTMVNAVSYVSGHDYCGRSGPFTTSLAKGKKIWMTEVCNNSTNDPSMNDGIGWAQKIHEMMNDYSASAWIFWVLVHDDASANTCIFPTGGINTRRYYTIGNFSKYVRPGFFRIEATPSNQGNVLVSSYKNKTTGQFAIVAINKNGGATPTTFSLDFAATSVTPHLTTSSINLADQPAIAVANNSFTSNLPGNSVTTFTGTSGTATNIKVAQFGSSTIGLSARTLYNLRGQRLGDAASAKISKTQISGVFISVAKKSANSRSGAIPVVR